MLRHERDINWEPVPKCWANFLIFTVITMTVITSVLPTDPNYHACINLSYFNENGSACL